MFPSPREADCCHHRRRSYQWKADSVTWRRDNRGCVEETETLVSLPFHLDLAVEKQQGSRAASAPENRGFPVCGGPAPWMSQEEESVPPWHPSLVGQLCGCAFRTAVSVTCYQTPSWSLVSPALFRCEPSRPPPATAFCLERQDGREAPTGEGAGWEVMRRKRVKALGCPVGQRKSCEAPWHYTAACQRTRSCGLLQCRYHHARTRTAVYHDGEDYFRPTP